jgi:hypothetical protein
MVARKFMDKNKGFAGTRFFVVEPNAVVSRYKWHAVSNV